MTTLYFRQLLAGTDFGRDAPFADQMKNFIYLIGDRDTGEALVVDPAWAVREVVDLAAADGMTIVGALVTHYHQDHVGGNYMGLEIDGLPTLMEACPCPVHVNTHEADGVRHVTGLEPGDLVKHDSGDRVQVGGVEVELLHTPGHTPGSQCFRVAGSLVSGDTLFLTGCGRTDLPGGDSDTLFRSLQQLKQLPPDTVLYPGHEYGGAHAPMRSLMAKNAYLQVPDLPTWQRMMGR